MAEEEKVNSEIGEHVVLPEGVTTRDLVNAVRYRDWLNQKLEGRGSSEPMVAGRPAWISSLTKEEKKGFQKAVDFIRKVESNPRQLFQKQLTVNLQKTVMVVSVYWF